MRECREEIGAEVVPGRLLLVRDYIAAHHEFAAENPEFHQVELMFETRLAPGAEPIYAGDLPSIVLANGWTP